MEVNIKGKHIQDSARVCGSALVCGSARVCDSARVCGSALVCGSARVAMMARITKSSDYICFTSIGSREGNTLTAWRDVCGIGVNCGCFTGTLKEFEKRVKETHGNNEHGREYRLAIKLIKERAKRWKPITKAERSEGSAKK